MSRGAKDRLPTKRDRILWWIALLVSFAALGAIHHALNRS